MGARRDLNEIYFAGSVALAGLLGLATGSWAVAAVTAVALLALCWQAGKIR